MSQHIVTVTDASLEAEVVTAPGLVLLDFWAEWCAPCKSLLPIVTELATDYVGEVKIAKINADDNAKSAERYGVRGLPTLILFRDGVEQERLAGLTSKTRLAALLDKHLEA